MKRRMTVLLLALVFVGVGCYIFCPRLVVSSDEKILFSVPAEKGLAFSTRFIHSVQKTPVEEYFTVNERIDGVVLHSTRYQSFGVGLPFLSTDGNFKRDGDWFVMEGMERKLSSVVLRPGVGTELTLRIKDKIFPLYEMVPLGTPITVQVVPRYKIWSGLDG